MWMLVEGQRFIVLELFRKEKLIVAMGARFYC